MIPTFAEAVPASRESAESLELPALRARMGDWTYYFALMKMSDLAARVSLASEIHQSMSLRDLIQREVRESEHAAKIRDYLLQQPQRLFNALVIAVYGGSPDWYELAIKPNPLLDPEELPTSLQGTLGILRLIGTEQLFAIDGQHRLVGIKQATAQRPALGDEEVAVLFVGHDNSPAGLERTRRLFTTLNRYAKPVSMLEKIALDEDDVVAIVVRQLIGEHPLFKDKVSLAKAKQIHTTDQRNFTSVVALYDSLDFFLRRSGAGWANFKRFRPPEDQIGEFYRQAKGLWDLLAQAFPPLREYMQSEPSDHLAAPYRHRGGGHLLFRPVGLQAAVRTLRHLQDAGVSLDEGVHRLSRMPMDVERRLELPVTITGHAGKGGTRGADLAWRPQGGRHEERRGGTPHAARPRQRPHPGAGGRSCRDECAHRPEV